MAENEINEGSDEIRISDRTEHTSKHTADEAVSDSERAEGYEQRFTTFSDNDEDQSFKAIQPAADSFGIDFGDGTVETAKGKVPKPHSQEFFEAKAQGAMTAMQNLDKQPKYQPDQLIAANVIPNNPVMSDATLPTRDRNDDTTPAENTVAWGEDTLIPRITVPSTDRLFFPYRGQEDQRLAECTKENPGAWTDAFNAYPKLQQYMSSEQAYKLMKALVRNELHWFDVKDKGGDKKAKDGNPDLAETLGYSQITPNGVSEFETGIINGQKAREPDQKLTEFLKEKGHSGNGHEARALEDPSCVPMIIAAKLNTLVDLYEKSGTAINYRTLAYGYNADVYYNPNNPTKFHSLSIPGAAMVESQMGNKKTFPTDSDNALNASNHLKNIEEQMKLIQ